MNLSPTPASLNRFPVSMRLCGCLGRGSGLGEPSVDLALPLGPRLVGLCPVVFWAALNRDPVVLAQAAVPWASAGVGPGEGGQGLDAPHRALHAVGPQPALSPHLGGSGPCPGLCPGALGCSWDRPWLGSLGVQSPSSQSQPEHGPGAKQTCRVGFSLIWAVSRSHLDPGGGTSASAADLPPVLCGVSDTPHLWRGPLPLPPPAPPCITSESLAPSHTGSPPARAHGQDRASQGKLAIAGRSLSCVQACGEQAPGSSHEVPATAALCLQVGQSLGTRPSPGQGHSECHSAWEAEVPGGAARTQCPEVPVLVPAAGVPAAHA